jgi:hypothetical protein
MQRTEEGHTMGSAMVANSSCIFHGTVTADNHITFTVFNCTYGQAIDFTGTIYSDGHLESIWFYGTWKVL